MLRCLLGSFSLIALAALAGCDAGSSSGPADSTDATPRELKGCANANPKTAPGGYYTNGATVCTADGTPHLFHGLDRPSLEWDPQGEWDNSEGIPRSDFDAMASWHANVVRIALTQDFWLSNAARYVPSYEATVDKAVKDAEAAGMDVILDLHWSDRGDLTALNSGDAQNTPGHIDQQPMADVYSLQFWREVASKYKDDGHVLFELYNEPNKIDWPTWLNGGQVAEYQAAGMQQMYNAVRVDAGADNIVIAGGLSYAFDLSQARNYLIQGYNVMYATHPYSPQNPQSSWDSRFGYLAAQDIAPVIATEFGDTGNNCTGAWNSALVAYADARQISWTAWAWWAGGCNFPSLISDWKYTPTVQGAVIRDALLGYDYEPAGKPSPAGGAPAGGAGGTAGKGGTGGTNPVADAGESGTSDSAGGAPAEGGASGSDGT
ncbi:MAG: glycoside hydrolase family 5 protein [Polyangiaceae bacterium]